MAVSKSKAKGISRRSEMVLQENLGRSERAVRAAEELIREAEQRMTQARKALAVARKLRQPKHGAA